MKVISKLCTVLFLMSSCAVGQKVNKYSAGYTFWYTQYYKDVAELTRNDSVTINGTVVNPIEKKTMQPMVVQFINHWAKEPEMGVFAYCDKNGNFTIKIRRGDYDITASDGSLSNSFSIQSMGTLGSEMNLKIYTQKMVMSKFLTYE